MVHMLHKEIEVRFLEIDPDTLIKRLRDLKAVDYGEDILEETIFYDKGLKWQSSGKFVRLRKNKTGVFLTYKHHLSETVGGAEEIEFIIGDMSKAETFLERLGLVAYRHQQKKRHSFQLGEVVADIDTWPRIPTYIELEGPTEESLKQVATKLNLDWRNVVLENARLVIENRYHIPVGNMKWFTFDKFE